MHLGGEPIFLFYNARTHCQDAVLDFILRMFLFKKKTKQLKLRNLVSMYGMN